MRVRVTTVVSVLLLFLQLNCGGTTNDTFSQSESASVQTAGGSALTLSTGKGVSIEGSVGVPTSSKSNVTIGTDTAQEVTISKNVVSNIPAKEGEVCCKRYDGITVANGSVDASGEIVGTIVPPSSLDATEQVICEVKLEDGRTLLNHYDLTNKAEGDRVRVDVSAASTATAEQVLLECGSAATFKNMGGCAYQLTREDFNPRKLFEKYRDKIASDASSKVEEPLKPVVSEEDAKKVLEFLMQTPYGLDKTRDRSEQGNLGRPLMGEPYGHDKDAVKGEKTTPRGRPFRYEPPPPPPPPPPPDPTPEPPPPAILKAPVNVMLGFSVMSSGWNLAITPETLGGARYQSFAKSVSWSYLPDPNIAGFRVYEKAPGESAFQLVSTHGGASSTGTTLVNVWAAGSGGVRVANQWPVGTYESYVVAYDAEGKEGPASAVATATNLGEIEWLRPTEGQILESYYPTFQWSNVWPAEIQASGWSYPNNWGWTEMTISEQGAIYNLMHGNVGWFTTSWRELLQPGHQYYIVVQTGGFATINGVKHFYLGYSRLVGFSAQ